MIPAALMAMTKGDAAAVLLSRFKFEDVDGTSRPMIVTPKM